MFHESSGVFILLFSFYNKRPKIKSFRGGLRTFSSFINFMFSSSPSRLSIGSLFSFYFNLRFWGIFIALLFINISTVFSIIFLWCCFFSFTCRIGKVFFSERTFTCFTVYLLICQLLLFPTLYQCFIFIFALLGRLKVCKDALATVGCGMVWLYFITLRCPPSPLLGEFRCIVFRETYVGLIYMPP